MKGLTKLYCSLLCLCCIFFFGRGYAQNKIFYSSTDLANAGKESHSIAKIRLPWGRLGKTIRVNYTDGCETIFGKRAIWGFEKDGRKLRLYDGEIFEIVDTGIIVLYKSFSPHPVYYFSEHLDSSVNLLVRPKLIRLLKEETLVQLWKENGIIRQML